MDDFKIRRGLSTTLFSSPGVVNPKLVLEEGCWYLCTDTAELFLGLIEDSGQLGLKRMNDVAVDSLAVDIRAALNALSGELAALEDLELFQKITSEADLPTDFSADDFNPNITYYLPLANNKVSTFIFDKVAQSYLCTNSMDELVVRALAIDAANQALNEKLPGAVKRTIESAILYGGNAIR